MGREYGWSKSDVEELTVEEVNYLIKKLEQEAEELKRKSRRG